MGGKAVADYLFEYTERDLTWAYNTIKKTRGIMLILARYEGAKSIVLDKSASGVTTVTPACHHGYHKQETSAYHNPIDDIGVDDGVVTLQDHHTRCKRDPTHRPDAQYCEEWKDDACVRCYYGFRPQMIIGRNDGLGERMLCLNINKHDRLKEENDGKDEHYLSAIKFCKDLDNYCDTYGEEWTPSVNLDDKCKRWTTQGDETSQCLKCKDNWILDRSKAECIENTLCKVDETDKDYDEAHCKRVNDPVTKHHMNGCAL